MKRRKFIQQSVALAAAGSLLQQCAFFSRHAVKGKIAGANNAVGHLLKDAAVMNAPSSATIHTPVLIIGGGISGLSAARWLQKNGHTDFLLAELDSETGGNAASGENEISAYPWGAHYVPLPNNNLTVYLDFLEECGVITGYENQLPVINELFLCFYPQERLYCNGYWQEGIVPNFGVPDAELQQIKKFLAAMEIFRQAKGTDGKDAFAIPADASSQDDEYQKLDQQTMKAWLTENKFTSPYLHWYVNYCCRDDFGTDYAVASAWAGIHYFAGRKGIAANAPAQSVITWPEGNAWLARQLKKDIEKNIVTNTLVLHMNETSEGVEVKILDAVSKKIKTVVAGKCIVATPQFVAARLMPAHTVRNELVKKHWVYQPWMVANLKVKKLQERNGAARSWDNVFYKGRGLGYVAATHQLLQQHNNKWMLTYYLPLTEKSAKEERLLAQKRTLEDWISIITEDFSAAHPDIVTQTETADVWIWGHGMISPQPGFITGTVKKQLQQPVAGKIFFAHTDLSGISIFEEAFYQGIKAANAVLNKV